MTQTAAQQQRYFAIQVVRKLRDAGFTAYWAGGCVRDELLEARPKDYDVATDATPDQIRQVFTRRRTIAIGAAFGVIAVVGGRRAGQIEVATFRSDAAYSDGRHPDSVTFASDREDALRRDFTINGLFYDPLGDRVIDYVGGRDDLRDRIVRAIGDPYARFEEDKLRLLRAVRFAAALDFQLEAETLAAVQTLAPTITQVSAERIAQEMRSMLVHPRRAAALRLLRKSNLLVEVLPEAMPLATDGVGDQCEPSDTPWRRALHMLESLQSPSFALALAALLHGVARAASRQSNTTDEASDPTVARPVLARAVGARWKLPNKKVDRVAWLLASEPTITQASAVPWPRLQRILIDDGIEELLALSESAATAAGESPAEVEHCRKMLSQPVEQLNPPPLLDGQDLIDHGVPRGPAYSELLRRVRDAQLDQQVTDKQAAFRLVDRLLADGVIDSNVPGP